MLHSNLGGLGGRAETYTLPETQTQAVDITPAVTVMSVQGEVNLPSASTVKAPILALFLPLREALRNVRKRSGSPTAASGGEEEPLVGFSARRRGDPNTSPVHDR